MIRPEGAKDFMVVRCGEEAEETRELRGVKELRNVGAETGE
jgi:hypothetical protein